MARLITTGHPRQPSGLHHLVGVSQNFPIEAIFDQGVPAVKIAAGDLLGGDPCRDTIGLLSTVSVGDTDAGDAELSHSAPLFGGKLSSAIPVRILRGQLCERKRAHDTCEFLLSLREGKIDHPDSIPSPGHSPKGEGVLFWRLRLQEVWRLEPLWHQSRLASYGPA